MFGQQGAERDFYLFLRGRHFGKHRGLVQRDAHVQADQHQHRREDKRNTPAPGHELLVGQQPGEQQEGAVGKEEANRRTQLREGAIERTLARWGVLGRQQRRAAPFTAQTQTLTKTGQRQQQRSQNTDGLVGRQQADGDGGDPHGQQRGDQRHLTPDAIAEVAEQRRTNRTCDKGDGEGRQRLQRGRRRVALREEDMRENDDRSGGVNIEVEEFDGGANQRCDDDFIARVNRDVFLL